MTGHPDGICRREKTDGHSILEIKTRNSGAFRRWKTLGAERSHPAAVAQLALYTAGTFGEWRDGVLACMDVGERTWDYEIIPAGRLALIFEEVLRPAVLMCRSISEARRAHCATVARPATTARRTWRRMQ